MISGVGILIVGVFVWGVISWQNAKYVSGWVLLIGGAAAIMLGLWPISSWT